ncbi:MAG TPA: phosphohistidine phosphatase SixA, partial [Myxococcales bacterium]|nr:phosphohistidine phosphatase SixA [Myxococcales bacterium]
MEIFLVRHGVAVDRDGDIPDAFRSLTSKGRRRFRKTARSLARLGCKLDLILTSPLVRAVQTAEILASETKHGEVAVLEELDPKYAAADLLKAVTKRAEGVRSVALVGHEPQLSAVLAALAAVDADRLDVKKGAIVRLDAQNPSERGSAGAFWSLKPKSKTVKKGLPLTKADGEDENAAEPTAKGKKKRSRPRQSAKRRSAHTAAAEAPAPAESALETSNETATPAPAAAAGAEPDVDEMTPTRTAENEA